MALRSKREHRGKRLEFSKEGWHADNKLGSVFQGWRRLGGDLMN